MSAATPTKKRAALGSLDINVTRSPTTTTSSSSANKLFGGKGTSASPLKKTAVVSGQHATSSSPSARNDNDNTPRKRRALEDGGGHADIASPAFKKLCSVTATMTAPKNSFSPVNDAKGVAGRPKVSVEDADEDSPPASQPSARRSVSPDASSLFDTSAINTSQLTTITEPDAHAPVLPTATTTATAPHGAATSSAVLLDLPPPRQRRVPTREEMRQKAEILKLRLSLATYKVKTNQTDVPLDKLQIRPVPGMGQRRAAPLPSMSAHTVHRTTPAQYWYRSLAPTTTSSSLLLAVDRDGGGGSECVVEGGEDGEEGGVLLPRVVGTVSTPRKMRSSEEEARLTSSALRGGAAKGLLSLSQASS